jgi:CBS domain-containing protein
MNVEAIATKTVITLNVNDSLLDASRLLREKGIRHLPVVAGDGRLVGIVTDRDIKKASASEATSLDIHELMYLLDKLQVSKVMTKAPATVQSGTPIRDAAKLMVEKKIGCLPVVDNGKLTGIVTEIDMLRLLADSAP